MDKLSELRADFEMRSKRSMSMPIAGAIVWCVIAVLVVVAYAVTIYQMATRSVDGSVFNPGAAKGSLKQG